MSVSDIPLKRGGSVHAGSLRAPVRLFPALSPVPSRSLCSFSVCAYAKPRTSIQEAVVHLRVANYHLSSSLENVPHAIQEQAVGKDGAAAGQRRRIGN